MLRLSYKVVITVHLLVILFFLYYFNHFQKTVVELEEKQVTVLVRTILSNVSDQGGDGDGAGSMAITEAEVLDMSLCVNARKLLGLLEVTLDPPPLSKTAEIHPELELGGYFVPNCSHSQNVAIIVPCHNRDDNLESLIFHLHPILQRQELEYQIFVVDQEGDEIFNKASLMNVAVTEALKIRNFSCFIFHDVDLIPETDQNIYDCPPHGSARHLSVAIDIMKYKPAYETLFGGVTALSRDDFLRINGFSNRFYGWGGEDDDIRNRVTAKELKIIRPSPTVARYKMLDHDRKSVVVNKKSIEMVQKGKFFFETDGLSDLGDTVKTVQVTLNQLYTFITALIVKPSKNVNRSRS